ncbi:MAG: SMP-30/gluconolactonase/LRE family protein [Acidobacteriota bacterium]|nr:SMP-30/gluconolactonase/LRE family protein [Acidobacteriota bacterium]
MSVIKRVLLLAVVAIVLVLAYLSFWPVPIEPVAWTPPAAPALTGTYQQNDHLAGTERLSLGDGFAPEDVALDSEQRIYAGFDDGRIMRLQRDGTRPELFADTKGRPLGLRFDSAGSLIVADAVKGLLSVRGGLISVLTTAADGIALGITNDLDIAANGTIYFTDASSRFPLTNYKADILEHQSTGRLLAYEPATKTTRLILGGLSFANGVAISPDQSFVLVNETGKYRIHRVWLNGANAGKSEIFIDNLPGFPDGISSNGKDKFWLALVTPRDATLDKLLPHPFLRKAVWRLPPFLRPAPKRYSFVLGLDTNGRVVENLQNGSSDCYALIANAVEHDSVLYFGSIGEAAVGRWKIR